MRPLPIVLAVASLALPSIAITIVGCKDKSDDDSSKEDEARKKKRKKKSSDDDDKKKSDDDDKPKKKTGDDDDDDKPKKKTGDPDPDDPPPKSSGGDKLAPTDEALKSGSEKNHAVFFEGDKHDLKFGKAYAGYGGLHVTLSTEKLSCSYATPSDDSFTVDFDIPPGPGDAFFAGHAIGLPVYWNSQRVKLKSTYAGPHLVSLTVDPFKLGDGEHVKGSLRFDHKAAVTRPDSSKVTYEYKGIGPFDVVICDDFQHFAKLKGEPAVAPPGPVSGTFGSTKFEAKSALAIVSRDYSNGGLYIDSIELYPVEATCSDRFSLWKSETWLALRSLGGTGNALKLSGQQPADATFNLHSLGASSSSPKWFGGGGRRAWVRIDKLEFSGGSKITGELAVASVPGSKPDETGSIGGHFTAKVCGSTY